MTTINQLHLQQAIALNNEGVSCFRSGNLLDATRCIQQAYLALKEGHSVRAASGQHAHDEQGPRMPSTTTALSDGNATKSLVVDIVDDIQSHLSFFRETDVLHGHFRPLPISLDILHQYSSSPGEEENLIVDMVFSFLTFNLSLAFHCSGTTMGSEALLRRSMDLYCVVLKMHDPNRGGVGRGGSGSGAVHQNSALIQCLALNNMAHIHYEFCEFESSHKCLGFMMNIHDRTKCLCSSMSSNSRVHLPTAAMRSEWEMDEVKLNILYATAPTMAGSA